MMPAAALTLHPPAAMYSEWGSFQHDIQLDTSNTSVLHCFPELVGREVACVVVKHLSQTLSLSATNSEPSNLTTDKQVRWTMEVRNLLICIGFNE